MMSALYLLVSGVFEIIGVSSLNFASKAENRLRKALFIGGTVSCGIVSLTCLSFAMQSIPLSIAYAIFVGIGSVGALAISVIFNGDQLTLRKSVSAALVIGSAIMLKII